MLEQLINQVRRLFSSKSNGGRLVYILTDRLHYYKQVLLAISIVLLIGHNQFRSHFYCQGVGSLDSKILNHFCWTIGTKTIESKSQNKPKGPNAGLNFMPASSDSNYEIVDHSYMQSLWALLIVMIIFSYLAQRSWSLIFQNQVLRALLQLPGYETLPATKIAQKLQLYHRLRAAKSVSNTPANMSSTSFSEVNKNTLIGLNNQLVPAEDANEMCLDLDYYPNQLIYLLLAEPDSLAYQQMADLKLRHMLLRHSICSFLATSLQYLSPLYIIGTKYSLYGWRFSKAWLRYTLKQYISYRTGKPSPNINTVDYAMSSRIWPLSVQCHYEQYGLQGHEGVTSQCTAPINEICGRLFVVIWWFIAINLVIEIWALVWALFVALSYSTAEIHFGRKYWPKARRQAQEIIKFRYRMAQIKCKIDASDRCAPLELESESLRKQFEAEQMDNSGCDKREEDRTHRRRYLWSMHNLGVRLTRKLGWFSAVMRDEAGVSSNVDENKLNTAVAERKKLPKLEKHEANLLYLLYLLHLRLGRSQKTTEQIITMSADALTGYLAQIEADRSELRAQLRRNVVRDHLSSTADTIIDVMA